MVVLLHKFKRLGRISELYNIFKHVKEENNNNMEIESDIKTYNFKGINSRLIVNPLLINMNTDLLDVN